MDFNLKMNTVYIGDDIDLLYLQMWFGAPPNDARYKKYVDFITPSKGGDEFALLGKRIWFGKQGYLGSDNRKFDVLVVNEELTGTM